VELLLKPPYPLIYKIKYMSRYLFHMAIRRQQEQQYAHLFRSLAHFLQNSSGFPVSGVARTGSRITGMHRDRSDLDVYFCISGDPLKEQVYPPLVEGLKKTLKVNADIGRSYNVINIWKEDINCDLVLYTEAQFKERKRTGQFIENL
jgi:predicted nucleotidyltransferase